MPTTKQEKDFIEWITSNDMLDLAIDWISNNMAPEDVFSTTELEKWAVGEGYIKLDT